MSIGFCPKCGASTAPRNHDGQTVPCCTSPRCGFVFWQNSKPCASLVIINEKGELLLGVRGIEPEKGKLDLPGGFLQLGEHPFDGAKREAKEELGVDIDIVKVLGFVMDTYGPGGDATLNIALLAKITHGTCAPADDVAELIWADPKTQTASPLAFSNNEKIIRMYLESLGE